MADKDPAKSGDQVPKMVMRWSRENYDHLQLMAALTGQSVTAYVNALIDADRERNRDIAKEAQALAAKVKH